MEDASTTSRGIPTSSKARETELEHFGTALKLRESQFETAIDIGTTRDSWCITDYSC